MFDAPGCADSCASVPVTTGTQRATVDQQHHIRVDYPFDSQTGVGTWALNYSNIKPDEADHRVNKIAKGTVGAAIYSRCIAPPVAHLLCVLHAARVSFVL